MSLGGRAVSAPSASVAHPGLCRIFDARRVVVGVR